MALYGNLARFIVAKRAKAFCLSKSDSEDLLQSLLLEMFKAPLEYRNYRGISVLLKCRMRDLLRNRFTSKKRSMEVLTDTCPEPRNPEASMPTLLAVEHDLICKHLDILSSAERSVLGLLYGLDGFAAVSQARAAKMLGRDVFWVSRRHDSAIKRLRGVLRISR